MLTALLLLVLGTTPGTSPRVGFSVTEGQFTAPLYISAFTQIDVYVLADRPDGWSGFELAIDDVQDRLTFLEVEFGDPAWTNHGDEANWLVELGECWSAPGIATLGKLTVGSFTPTAPPDGDLLCLVASSPSALDPPAPARVDCAGAAMAVELVETDWFSPGCTGNWSVLNYVDFAHWEARLPAVQGSPGSPAAMDLAVSLDSYEGHCFCAWVDMSSASWTLQWDPAIASFESFEWDPAIPGGGWTVLSTPKPGQLELSMSGGAGYLGGAVGTLRLLPLQAGDTVVSLAQFGMTGGHYSGPDARTLARCHGELSVTPVATQRWSFGGFKAGP